MSAGKWRHSMRLDCFRKLWPSGSIGDTNGQKKFSPVRDLLLQRHKSGIHVKRDPRNRELKCLGILKPSDQQ
jgi:hypothetical protein